MRQKDFGPTGRNTGMSVPRPAASKLANFGKWYRQLWGYEIAEAKPPYGHVCQIGDPILRSKAELVPCEKIRTPEIQKVIAAMRTVLKSYDTVGISAPQIGVPYRIILIDFSDEAMKSFNPEIRRIREMEVCPPQLIINPSVTVLDHLRTTIFTEACASVRGYSASVKRFHVIRVNGLTETGKPMSWTAKGWLARIIQHEVDHVDGQMYTDIMDTRTFQCDNWHIVNFKKGRYKITYK